MHHRVVGAGFHTERGRDDGTDDLVRGRMQSDGTHAQRFRMGKVDALEIFVAVGAATVRYAAAARFARGKVVLDVVDRRQVVQGEGLHGGFGGTCGGSVGAAVPLHFHFGGRWWGSGGKIVGVAHCR